MSFMTTSMSVPHIWASDDEMRAARRAGWRRRDLFWERLSERANADLAAGGTAAAFSGFKRAFLLARLGFQTSDPRYATSLANAAFVDFHTGKTPRAQSRILAAQALWYDLSANLGNINIRPRARSSLFHLRMEARHWETYKDNARNRLNIFLGEAAQAIKALSEQRAPEHRLYGRWRGEKPSVFDDTRIYLSAALLLAGDSTATVGFGPRKGTEQ